MLKLSIVFGLLASIIWRTTPTNCRQTHNQTQNINQLAAINIERYMDVDEPKPCDNFYQYACGNWYQQHIDEMDYGDVLGLMDYELNKKLEHLLRKSPASSSSSSSAMHSDEYVNTGRSTTAPTTTAESTRSTTPMAGWEQLSSLYGKIRTYYKSCKKVKPYNLKKYLQLIQPGPGVHWYVLAKQGGRKWNADKFDWLETIAKLRLYGLNGVLLKEQVLPRWDESSSMSIYLDKPDLSETSAMGEGVIIELLMDIGQTKRWANEIAREVNRFEFQLHKLQELEDEEGPKEMQLSYLQEYMPQIDWLTYIRQLKGPDTDLATTVIIQNIPYMRSLVKLLNSVEPSNLCNYIMIKFLLYLKTQGPAEISRQECIASLRRAMPLALSYVVGLHYYKDAERNDAQVLQLFEQLKQTFHTVLEDNRLQLPQPIVETQLQKIHTMQLRIGFAPRNISGEYMSQYYERVTLDGNNFYANQLSLLRLTVERSHETLDPLTNQEILNDESVISAEWLGSSSSPLYLKSRNMVVIPYGFLHMPIYHRNLKDIYKYSVLGFALAHEMLHGFDSSGIDYDASGNIMGPSEEISANQRFMQGLRCMQNELATGSRSLNEKLADYEGIRLAFNAYFTASRLGNETLIVKHLRSRYLNQFTPQQVFFINFAQFFCGKVHPKLTHSAYLDHAMDELRVLQTLANFEEFSKAFGCEKRDKMQSRHRCRLW
ncbi:neprilysin-4 [Stomoxys calcitrans]|uniref:neprilysin-4 n=1 Tax=Stomoxys calcitrans TaxID=35570 RepID=UPI0027E28318|nr:neprilysin-4 [Stomoxys calcitrans]